MKFPGSTKKETLIAHLHSIRKNDILERNLEGEKASKVWTLSYHRKGLPDISGDRGRCLMESNI